MKVTTLVYVQQCLEAKLSWSCYGSVSEQHLTLVDRQISRNH